MGKKRLEKRCKVKPFVKAVNFVHLMPTRYDFLMLSLSVVCISFYILVSVCRYSVDLDLKKLADSAVAKETKTETKKSIKKIFEERYKGQNKTDKKAASVQYFFNKLRF